MRDILTFLAILCLAGASILQSLQLGMLKKWIDELKKADHEE